MKSPLNILLVEDNPLDTELILRELTRAEFDPAWLRVDTEAEYLKNLNEDFDLILSDYQMPQFNGMQALELLKERGLTIPFILVSGTIGEDIAVQAMKQGATDYLLKDRLTRLGSAVQHALEESRLRKQQKAAMEALRLREIALNSISQGVVITDENRLIIYGNAGFTQLTDYAESEILGRNCSLLQGPNSDPATILKIRAALNAGEAFEGEILNYRKDGETFWNDLSISPIPGQEGEPLRFIGIQRDVTQRKLAEAALAASEMRYHTLFENMVEGYAFCQILYEKGRAIDIIYLEVNSAFESLSGLKDVVGKKVSELVPEIWKSSPELLEVYSRVASTGQTERFEMHVPSMARWFYITVYSSKKEHFIAVFDNITERKQGEEALRQSEALFAAAFEQAPIGIALISPEGRWLKVNQALCDILGYASAEFLACTYQDITHAEDLPADLDTAQRLIAGEISSYQLEKRYIHARGHSVPVLLNASLVRDGQGLPLYFIAQIQDITERKRVQQDMLRKTAFLEAQVNSSLDATIVVDQRGRKTLQNQRAVDLFGIPQDISEDPIDEKQVLWVKDMTKNPGEFLEKVMHFYAHPEESGHDEIELKNGTILDRYTFPVVGRDGKYYGRTWTFRDISERKQVETRMRRLVDSNAQGVFFWSTNGELTVANDAFLEVIGYTRDDLDAGLINWLAITPPEYADLDRQALRELAASGICSLYEKEFLRKDGSRVPILIGAAMFEDNPDDGVCFVIDITNRKQAEQKLSDALAQEKELAEKARAGDRAKGEFLAVMSHELRTPLNSILGFSELLAKTPNLSTESRDFVQTISSSGEALLRLLNDVLDFSRLEAGNVQIEKTQYSPKEIIADVRTLLVQQVRDKGLSLEIEICKNAPERMEGDSGRLQQILLNLVGNAIKFTEHGTLTLGLRLAREAGMVELFVKDTGIGIKTDQIERIFQPFAQADSSISRRHGGSGLGLSISRRLAELMGGTLTVQSTPQEGSEFIVTLPVGDISALPKAQLCEQKLDAGFSSQHPLQILVVEDDKVNLKLMLNLLSRLGYHALSANNGIEALKIHRRELPNCVLMDLQMPEMDGIETTKQIRALEKASHLTAHAFISALTANVVPFDRQRCLDAGMNGYLNKPIKMAALAVMLVEAEAVARKSP